ncbi:MAG: hypothetical protein Ct9H300mP16_00020 [Pseudomonadota bacterium]|nr:MAG: hypothetical protein Ct9H300mP16_00020 [Pseudomonadota bacterium]
MPQAVPPANQVLAVVWRQRGTVRSDVGQTHPPCACPSLPVLVISSGPKRSLKEICCSSVRFFGRERPAGRIAGTERGYFETFLVYFLRRLGPVTFAPMVSCRGEVPWP